MRQAGFEHVLGQRRQLGDVLDRRDVGEVAAAAAQCFALVRPQHVGEPALGQQRLDERRKATRPRGSHQSRARVGLRRPAPLGAVMAQTPDRLGVPGDNQVDARAIAGDPVRGRAQCVSRSLRPDPREPTLLGRATAHKASEASAGEPYSSINRSAIWRRSSGSMAPACSLRSRNASREPLAQG